VKVHDLGSNAPIGCGDKAAVSGGFANEFDRETSRLLLFGFNPVKRFTDFFAPGHPSPFPGGPSWRVTVANGGWAARGAGNQTTFAYCVARPPHLRVAEARVPIQPSSSATATATCPRGTEAVSGGFSDQYAGTNGSFVFGFSTKRVGRRAWRASAINLSGSTPSALIALANCDPSEPGLTERVRRIEVPANGTRSTTVRCGRGREAWSAGFESPTGNGAHPYELRRLHRRAWRAAAFTDGQAASFTLHVYCR
jgi:hypothetical protein